METKNKILIILIILMLGVLATFAYLIFKDKKTTLISTSAPAPSLEEAFEESEEDSSSRELTPEEKEEVFNIKNSEAIIKTVDIGAVKVYLIEEQEEIVLDIPQEETVSFFKQTKQADDSFLNEEIPLSEIKPEQEALVQYNSKDNQLKMIVIENN